MEEQVRRLIRRHQSLRPRMEVQDAYKLLFQSIMGLGHLLTNVDRAKSYLLEELATLSDTGEPEDLIEDISLDNTMVRINLRPFQDRGLDAAKLFAAMLETEKLNTASTSDFIPVWQTFVRLVESGELAFDPAVTTAFNDRIGRANYPVMHHLEIYRQIYRPAYRIIDRGVFNRTFGAVMTQPLGSA